MIKKHESKQTLVRFWSAVAYDKPTDRTGEEWLWLTIKLVGPLFIAYLALLVATALVALTQPELVDAIPQVIVSYLATISDVANTLIAVPAVILVVKTMLRALHDDGVLEPELDPEETLGGEA